MVPIAMIDDWKAIGSPMRSWVASSARVTLQSSRLRWSVGIFFCTSHRHSRTETS